MNSGASYYIDNSSEFWLKLKPRQISVIDDSDDLVPFYWHDLTLVQYG